MLQPQKILIIRRDNIGDLVCTTPALAALRKHFPKAQIAALVNSYNAEVLRGNPNVDRVFVYQKLKHAGSLFNRIKALAKRLCLIASLRRWQPDVTILAKSSYDRHGLRFARQIDARSVIGFSPEATSPEKVLPDIQLPAPNGINCHEVEALNILLAPVGVKDALGPLQVFPCDREIIALKKRLPDSVMRIGLHVSAREEERRWGVDNFIALTQWMLGAYQNAQILLFWSPGSADDPFHPGDDQAARVIIDAVGSERLIPMPTESLTDLIAGLSLCDIFIGTDGGALHLAVGLNKPCVALFENLPSKLNHWYPWQVEHRIVHGERPEVASIGLRQVVSAVEWLWARQSELKNDALQ